MVWGPACERVDYGPAGLTWSQKSGKKAERRPFILLSTGSLRKFSTPYGVMFNYVFNLESTKGKRWRGSKLLNFVSLRKYVCTKEG